MSKAEFDRQRQLLWVYLRHRAKCAICAQEMSRHEAATSPSIEVALAIDDLLQVRLMHSQCKSAEAGWRTRPAAAA